MRAGGGKAKGAAQERLVCKKLSLWLSGGTDDSWLWRSAMSGGRATVAHKKGKLDAQVGDISAVDSRGHKLIDAFAIEVKFYKDIRFDSLFTSNPALPSVLGFWLEIEKQAKTVTKKPMLIFKQNRGDVWVLLKSADAFQLGIKALVTVSSLVTKTNLALIRLDDFCTEAKVDML